tara:strand:+ start:415 stop:720 length:306 start_codon:yes stop_codon:yes gene_type:complete
MEAYIYQADLLCDECAEVRKKDIHHNSNCQDSEDYPQGPYLDGGGESDYPQHCGNCNMFLENSLTSDGEKELTILLSKPASNGIADIIHAQYKDYYSYLFE